MPTVLFSMFASKICRYSFRPLCFFSCYATTLACVFRHVPESFLSFALDGCVLLKRKVACLPPIHPWLLVVFLLLILKARYAFMLWFFTRDRDFKRAPSSIAYSD